MDDNVKSIVASHSSRLIERYPAAYRDFFSMPSGAPCIYKSGPAWPEFERKGTHAQSFIREARPIYDHPIAGSWLKIGTDIYKFLDSCSVMWTSIDPVAFANAGEKKPFCTLLIWIGVKQETLLFDAAVAAADVIKRILTVAGFPEIEVAFRESEVTHSVAQAGPKLFSFNPLDDPIPAFRKPFTPTIGLSIAPLKAPHLEGTGSLYFRLSKDDDRIVLLTAAHVARPPPICPDIGTGYRHTHTSQRLEKIVALGEMGYRNATNAMITATSTLKESINRWNKAIAKQGEFVEGEPVGRTERRRANEREVENATMLINNLKTFHDEVTKYRANPVQRTIGFVLHSEPIVIPDGPNKFTCDWAFIQLYPEMIDWNTFPGNKVYLGGDLSPSDFGELMFPQPNDRADYDYPEDELLPVFGVVKDDEIRRPNHLDVHGEKALLVVKNGRTTGTTIGRTNGLESFTRPYIENGPKYTSIDVAVLPYDKLRGPFSAAGDSGSIILDRAGRIVALLTGGAGTAKGTDITYGTPYWWLEEQIKKVFPDCHLYTPAT
ncbi:hypothetical protein FRC01_008107 [Tulasnella sp. 417]|nr:hypothetical protein FRC01_008107 [Tulasnella sp. 417]